MHNQTHTHFINILCSLTKTQLMYLFTLANFQYFIIVLFAYRLIRVVGLFVDMKQISKMGSEYLIGWATCNLMMKRFIP